MISVVEKMLEYCEETGVDVDTVSFPARYFLTAVEDLGGLENMITDSQISEITGMSCRTIKRCRKLLVDIGLIDVSSVNRRLRDRDFGTRYYFHFNDM